MVESREGDLHMNIIDYVHDYGNVSFEDSPFNDVDNAVLCSLIYISFEKFLDPESFRPMTLGELLSIYLSNVKKDELLKDTEWHKNQFFLALAMFNSKRYSDIYIYSYGYHISNEMEAQFTAFAFSITDDTDGICYRGTDTSFAGLKEDFNMFFMDETGGEHLAYHFLKQNILARPDKNFIVMGHSKGGIHAVYAASKLSEEEASKILRIYSCDGPGNHSPVYEYSEGYQRIKSRIIHIIPYDSFIGILFGHFPIAYVVQNEKTHNFTDSHDTFYWQIEGKEFVKVEDRSPFSYYIQESFDEICSMLDNDERTEFIEVAFDTMIELGYDDPIVIQQDMSKFWKTFLFALSKKNKNSPIMHQTLRIIANAFKNHNADYLRRLKEEKQKQKSSAKQPQKTNELIKKTVG